MYGAVHMHASDLHGYFASVNSCFFPRSEQQRFKSFSACSELSSLEHLPREVSAFVGDVVHSKRPDLQGVTFVEASDEEATIDTPCCTLQIWPIRLQHATT